MQKQEILLHFNEFYVDSNKVKDITPSMDLADNTDLVTVLSSFAYYGYTPSMAGIAYLATLNRKELVSFWKSMKKALGSITGEKFKVGKHVLYKNFPKEVLDMTHSEYWLRQIFVYLGAPYSLVAQEEQERDDIDNELRLKVLSPVSTLSSAFNKLVEQKTRWTTVEEEIFISLLQEHHAQYNEDTVDFLDLSSYGFKENGLKVFHLFYKENINDEVSLNESINKKSLSDDQLSSLKELEEVFTGGDSKGANKSVIEAFEIKEATDVLRLSLLISEQDIRFSVAKFSNFPRNVRRALLSKLEESSNLMADVSERPHFFKKLFQKLHPGDFNNKYPNVKKAYHLIYNDNTYSYNARLENLIQDMDLEALNVASERPGVLLRRLHELYGIFGKDVIPFIAQNIENYDNQQLVKIRKYLETINDRSMLMFPPKGNWGRAKIYPNEKVKFKKEDLLSLQTIINNKIAERLTHELGGGVNLDDKMSQVKIPTNDQEVGSYGRGTEFDIPDDIKFIRTSSYWDISQGSFVDNTWNFTDENFNSLGVCCWNINKAISGNEVMSVFSGDAVNQKTGQAAQLVDVYLDKLEEAGVRYAFWSILSYNNIPFSKFDDLHAGLQFGKNPTKGKLFEPSRITMSFELKGEAKTKFLAYIDVKKRKLVFMDANLKASISSGGSNQNMIAEVMPAYFEYMESLPSYYDLLSVIQDIKGIPAVYDTKDIDSEYQGEYISFLNSVSGIKGSKVKLESFLTKKS